jgi:DNA-binding GntR family transcriptional regulator
MQERATAMFERRTTADAVFERLYKEIVSLELLPGTKLSEADVAHRFGVSRQPVREAFSRLGNMELVLVRPQKATVVRGFSLERVAHARFVRLAVELEVVTQACAVWTDDYAAQLQQNLEQQRTAIDSAPEDFHSLDSQFHKLICELGGCPHAVEAIQQCRLKIDRLCSLSLARQSEAATLLQDHLALADALASKSTARALEITRTHLSRLDSTIDEIHQTHAEYFE